MINTSLRPLHLPTLATPQRPTLSLPTSLETFSASPTPPPSTPTPPAAPPKSVGRIVVRTVIGAAEGALGGLIGGTVGGIVGGLCGLSDGGGLGFRAGGALGLHLAKKTGEGKVNPVAGGIGSLVLPVVGGGFGALVGTTAGVIAGAHGLPLVGAAIGGGCALLSELLR